MLPILVMLHGANGSGESLKPLAEALRPFAQVETPNLIGHGGRAVPDRLTIPDMANDVMDYLDRSHITRAYVFGYSLGGYLALYLARHFPHRLNGVCTLAVKHVFDAPTVSNCGPTWLPQSDCDSLATGDLPSWP